MIEDRYIDTAKWSPLIYNFRHYYRRKRNWEDVSSGGLTLLGFGCESAARHILILLRFASEGFGGENGKLCEERLGKRLSLFGGQLQVLLEFRFHILKFL